MSDQFESSGSRSPPEPQRGSSWKQERTRPQADGTYAIEFRTAAGETLALSIARGETAVIECFSEANPERPGCLDSLNAGTDLC